MRNQAKFIGTLKVSRAILEIKTRVKTLNPIEKGRPFYGLWQLKDNCIDRADPLRFLHVWVNGRGPNDRMNWS